VDRQNLLFHKKPLEINQRLSDYHVPNGAILDLHLRDHHDPPHPKPNPQTPHVIVRHQGGQRIRFETAPKEPVKHLQQRIYNRFRVRPNDQKLSHKGTPIEHHKRLDDYHLPNGAIIDLKVDIHRHHFVVFVRHPDGHKIP
jgi:hypothetical protein